MAAPRAASAIGHRLSAIGHQLTVAGPAGTQVKLTPEEVLGENGALRQRPHFGPCSFSYILAGHGKATWAPRFSSFGFRYVPVAGASRQRASGRPQVIAVELEHILVVDIKIGIRYCLRRVREHIQIQCN